jgi:hypothetical protein
MTAAATGAATPFGAESGIVAHPANANATAMAAALAMADVGGSMARNVPRW